MSAFRINEDGSDALAAPKRMLELFGGAGAPGVCRRPTAPAGRGEECPSLLLLSAWEKFAFQEYHFIFPGRTKKAEGHIGVGVIKNM